MSSVQWLIAILKINKVSKSHEKEMPQIPIVHYSSHRIPE